MIKQNFIFIFFLFLMLTVISSCVRQEPPRPEVKIEYVSQPARVPEGAVKYCWEEPVVEKQKERPGVNAEGTWYQPAHTAVREVRSGRWVACRGQRP